MNLLITRGTYPTVWQVEDDGRATELDLPDYSDHNLMANKIYMFPKSLPVEIVEAILFYCFYEYLKTWNLDLCIDLLKFSKSFTNMLYKEIYGMDCKGYWRQYRRLARSFTAIQNFYDGYLTERATYPYSCAKFVAARDPSKKNHQPWHFTHDCYAFTEVGVVSEGDESTLQARHGERHGENFWASGKYVDGVFRASQFYTPAVYIMFSDIHDSLVLGEKINDYYKSFLWMLEQALGKSCCIFVMIKEETDNPFITRSDVFLRF